MLNTINKETSSYDVLTDEIHFIFRNQAFTL